MTFLGKTLYKKRITITDNDLTHSRMCSWVLVIQTEFQGYRNKYKLVRKV